MQCVWRAPWGGYRLFGGFGDFRKVPWRNAFKLLILQVLAVDNKNKA
jgi:hypothetical protein